jgi:hypothetical protein
MDGRRDGLGFGLWALRFLFELGRQCPVLPKSEVESQSTKLKHKVQRPKSKDP